MRTELGKIESVEFGFGGYQDCMLGLTLKFSFNGSCVNSFINGGWVMEPTATTQWTKEDRAKQRDEMCDRLVEIMKQAKVDNVAKLAGIPVEVAFKDFNTFESFRILTEVL